MSKKIINFFIQSIKYFLKIQIYFKIVEHIKYIFNSNLWLVPIFKKNLSLYDLLKIFIKRWKFKIEIKLKWIFY